MDYKSYILMGENEGENSKLIAALETLPEGTLDIVTPQTRRLKIPVYLNEIDGIETTRIIVGGNEYFKKFNVPYRAIGVRALSSLNSRESCVEFKYEGKDYRIVL